MDKNNETEVQKPMYTIRAYNSLFQKLKRAKERERVIKEKVRELWNLLSRTK